MPGSIPATSQLDWLISTTAMIVLSWSKATRDLLKSFGWGIRALHQLVTATMVPSPRRPPHTIPPLEESGFEPSVPPSSIGHSDLPHWFPNGLGGDWHTAGNQLSACQLHVLRRSGSAR